MQFKKWEKRSEEIKTEEAITPTVKEEPVQAQPATNEALPLFMDRVRLMCLLCFRKFETVDALQLHTDKSEMHQTNLAKYMADYSKSILYRNRAAERRQVNGESDLTEAAKDTIVASSKSKEPKALGTPISSDNVGAILLKKMGWREGEGLGKDSEGMIEPLKATGKSRTSTGLGAKDEDKSYKDRTKEAYRDRWNKF